MLVLPPVSVDSGLRKRRVFKFLKPEGKVAYVVVRVSP